MPDLFEDIRRFRTTIRWHRDQIGDDRCFLDDYVVWGLLEGVSTKPIRLPMFADGMRHCRLFYQFRNASAPDPMPADAVIDPQHWDDDLTSMTILELRAELDKLQTTITTHLNIAKVRPLAIEDDRRLYNVLPEKIPADFRLPPENDFLGGGKAPHAGCPSFWSSHGNCKTDCHDFGRWGPCGD